MIYYMMRTYSRACARASYLISHAAAPVIPTAHAFTSQYYYFYFFFVIRDIPVHEVPWVLSYFNDNVKPALSEFVRVCWGETGLIIHDAFVVKYSCEEGGSGGGAKNATGIPFHYDESTYSFTIALNDGFEGGGTRFEEPLGVVKENVGIAVGFRGDESFHCGEDITSGTRYILVAFCYGRSEGGRFRGGLKTVTEMESLQGKESEGDGDGCWGGSKGQGEKPVGRGKEKEEEDAHQGGWKFQFDVT